MQHAHGFLCMQEARLLPRCVPDGGSGALPLTARIELVHGYIAHLARALVDTSEAEHSATAAAVALDFYARLQARVVHAAATRAEASGGAAPPHPQLSERTRPTALHAAHAFALTEASALRQRLPALPPIRESDGGAAQASARECPLPGDDSGQGAPVVRSASDVDVLPAARSVESVAEVPE